MKSKRPHQKLIQALPTYLGEKRQLLTWINTTVTVAYLECTHILTDAFLRNPHRFDAHKPCNPLVL